MSPENMSATELLQTTNGYVWAEEFMTLFGDRKDDIDLGLMIAWFANAIEVGRSAGQRHPSVEVIAGFLSTIDFTPSQHHPADCLPIAERVLEIIEMP